MKKALTIAFLATGLAACGVEPIVSDFNGSSVTIVTHSWDNEEHQRSTAQAEATRICEKVGKRAEYASTRLDPNTSQNYNLYLCL